MRPRHSTRRHLPGPASSSTTLWKRSDKVFRLFLLLLAFWQWDMGKIQTFLEKQMIISDSYFQIMP